MKKVKRPVIYSWIVLLSFVAGQAMVFAHTHLVKSTACSTHQPSHNQQTVTEKCQLCDAMHHNNMTLAEHHYFTDLVSSDHFYKKGKYDFISISLILSAGRSPPVS